MHLLYIFLILFVSANAATLGKHDIPSNCTVPTSLQACIARGYTSCVTHANIDECYCSYTEAFSPIVSFDRCEKPSIADLLAAYLEPVYINLILTIIMFLFMLFLIGNMLRQGKRSFIALPSVKRR